MVSNNQLTAGKVKELALSNRVVKDPAYHADQKGIRFDDILGVLPWCFRVTKDDRKDDLGTLRHPKGFVAFCQDFGGKVMRVYFNLAESPELILVVTAMEIVQ